MPRCRDLTIFVMTTTDRQTNRLLYPCTCMQDNKLFNKGVTFNAVPCEIVFTILLLKIRPFLVPFTKLVSNNLEKVVARICYRMRTWIEC